MMATSESLAAVLACRGVESVPHQDDLGRERTAPRPSSRQSRDRAVPSNITFLCGFTSSSPEDLAHRALRQIGEACVSLCRSALASVAGQKSRRPKFVGIAEVLGLLARSATSHALASSVIVSSRPGRERSLSGVNFRPMTRLTQRWTPL
jgi:hypothetical protein